ncbi:MAG: efflux transporter outer membrane subunit [Verrucomicrobiota bacterium]|nr:efflux transporter outer membrane subunit [Verrucomicrobiota bacterium]
MRKVFFLSWFLAGCTVGPEYVPPESQTVSHWKSPEQTVPVPNVECWWEIFHDEKLERLIADAIAKNPSLIAISEKVEQARDFSRVAKSRLFPQIQLDPSASNTPIRTHIFGSTSNPPPTLIKDHIDKYELPLTLLYEIDFWGKWRSQYRSALYKAEAQVELYNTALLLLTTDLANAYFQLRIQDAQIEVYRDILFTRQTALNIQQSRYDTHLINYTEVSTMQSDYSTVESQYYDALRKRALFENQIAVLVGESASEFKLDPMPTRTLPPVIPAGVPASVLLRRPDLREQERIMASMHAEINVAYASFFPSVDVSGGINFLSNDFMHTLKDKWFIGSNLVEILFDAGGRSANVEMKKAAFKEALSTYQQKVLTAVQEVEDSLSSLDWVDHEMRAIERAVEAMQITTQIALDRYKFGLASFLGAADSERKELEKKLVNLRLLSQRYLYTIHLIKAIGGGWN